ncbi:hypothetical protein PM082_009968 [Marasmius tenuissimus]|nr:hypothetical protein PM082_009968 [Marasmius tenuissimus]
MTKEDLDALSWIVVDGVADGNSTTLCVGEDRPAILTMVGVVNKEGTCVAPHGQYQGPTKSTPSLEEVRLTICLARPPREMQPFSVHFTSGLRMLQYIIGKKRSTAIGWKVGGISGGDFWGRPMDIKSITFSHNLFRPVDKGDFPFMDRDFTDRYKVGATSGWVVLPSAEQELRRIIACRSHKVQPVAARGRHGDLISPADLPSALRPGVLVQISFSLSHRAIPDLKIDKFSLIMQSVSVIV